MNLKFFIPESKEGVIRRIYHKSVEKGVGSNVELMCYITMESEVSAADLTNVATFSWNSLLETFENYGGAALPAVKKALRNGISKAQELLKNNKEIVEKGIDFEVTLIAIVEGNMYLALIGEHTVNLFRDGEVHLISEMLNSHNVNSGSIAVFPSDVIALTDSSKNLDWTTPRTLLTELDEKLNEEKLKYGAIFASQHVNFDDLIGLSSDDSPYDLTHLVEEDEVEESVKEEPIIEKTVIDDALIEEAIEEVDNLEKTEKNEDTEILVEDKEIEKEVITTHEIPENKVTEIKNKISGKYQSAVPVLMKIKEFFLRVWKFISIYIAKLVEVIKKVVSVISTALTNLASKQFGSQPWFKKFQAKLSQNNLGAKPSLGKIEIGGLNKTDLRNKRSAIFIAVIVGIVVVIVGVNKTKEAKQIAEIHDGYIAYEVSIEKHITEAEGKAKSNPESAAISLFEANKLVSEPTIDLSLLSASDQEALELLKGSIMSVEDKLYDRTAISQGSGMELFVDGKLKFGDNTDATDIAIYRDPTLVEYLYVTDKGLDSLFWITTAGKVRIVEDNGVGITDPLFVDIGAKGIYIYDGVIGGIRALFDENSGAVTGLEKLSGVSPDAFDVSDPQEMAIFTGTDNMYLLSQSDNSIKKSQGNGGKSYNLPYTYYSNESLSTVKDIFGDQMIYLLTAGSDGLGTYQYNMAEGRFDTKAITIVGPENAYENLTAGYTAGTMDKHLYVFDAAGKRVLVFEKPWGDLHPNSLLFLEEYVYRGSQENVWSDVKDIVVDAAETNLYVLDGSNIWKVPL
jgi:hypothetical protein